MTTNANGSPWFDDRGYMIRRLPADCVADCSASGDVTESVVAWRRRLGFEAPRELAVRYLRATGGWDAEELAALSDDNLSEKVLWLACCDAKESDDAEPFFALMA